MCYCYYYYITREEEDVWMDVLFALYYPLHTISSKEMVWCAGCYILPVSLLYPLSLLLLPCIIGCAPSNSPSLVEGMYGVLEVTQYLGYVVVLLHMITQYVSYSRDGV